MEKQNLLKRIDYLSEEASGEEIFTEKGRRETVKALKIVIAHCSEEDVKKWLKEEGVELLV